MLSKRGGRGRGFPVQQRPFTPSSRMGADEEDMQPVLSYICNFCKAVFPEKTKLRQHINGKHKQPKFECSGCGQKFQWSSSHFYHKNKCEKYLAQQSLMDTSASGFSAEAEHYPQQSFDPNQY